MADGHTCKIATHIEFKEWIESVRVHLNLKYIARFEDSSVSNMAMLEVIPRSSCAFVSIMEHSRSHS